jgi:membrane protease YdiL (CAAX protease family)
MKYNSIIVQAISILLIYLALGYLFENILNEYFTDVYFYTKVKKTTSKLCFLILILLVIIQNDFKKYMWYDKIFKIRNLQALIIPLMVIFLVLFSKMDQILQFDILPLLNAVFLALLIGLTEELYFRGILQVIFIKILNTKKNLLVIAGLLSSLIFALIHYVNLFGQPENIWGVTSQVIFAFMLGALFSGIFFRTGNIIAISILHALFNFSFGKKNFLIDVNESRTQSPMTFNEFFDLSTLLPELTLFLIISGSGVFMMYLAQKEGKFLPQNINKQ